MASENNEVVSLVMLLRQQRHISMNQAQEAAEHAFQVPFNQDKMHRVVAMPNKPFFGVLTPQMPLGIIIASGPYFKDVAATADRTREFAAKRAIQQHTAWISVDLMGDPNAIQRDQAYATIGKLFAELIADDVLGLCCTPNCKVAAYDPCFLQLLRTGIPLEIFKLGPRDNVIKTKSSDVELLAATTEAKKRWPEFLYAFANRRPLQGFGVKIKFVEGDAIEHMWIEIDDIKGHTITGRLSNDPQSIRTYKIGDPVTAKDSEIEDWVYTDGKQTFGGFQWNALDKNR